VSTGRGVHGKENPRKFYAVGLRTKPALIVRGRSRRIMIYAASTREYQGDQPSRKLPRARLALPPKSKEKKGKESCS
jgi:hypothetical protein